MDIAQYVNRRKGRLMAQVLELFEDDLQPLLPKDKAESFKAAFRKKCNGFADDMIDVLSDPGQARNGIAQDIRDRVHPHGDPKAATRGDSPR